MASSDTPDTLDSAAFAALVKAKHPEYKDVPDDVLAAKVLAKYPEYQSRVFSAPGEEKAKPNKSARVAGPPPAPSGVAGLAQGIKEDYVPKTYKSGDFLAGLKHEVAHPIDSASLLLGGAQQGSQDQFEKMFQAQSPVEAAGHGLAGLLPGIGPGAAQAGENIGKGNYAEGIGNAAGILAPFGVKPALGAVKGAIPDLVSGAKNLVGTGAAEGLGDVALAGKTSPTATGAAAISHAQQMFNAAKVAGGAKFKALGPLPVDLSDVADQLDSIGQLPAKASAARAAMNQAAATVKKSVPGFVPSKESLSFFPDYKQANIDYQQALTEVPFNEAQELVSDLGRRSKIIRGGPPPDPAVMKAYKGVDDAIGRSADQLDENGRAAYQDAKDFWKKNVADVYYRGHGDDLLSLAKDPHKVTSVIGPHDVEAVKGIRQALIPDWADPAAKAQGQKVWNNVRQAWASDKLLGAPEAGDTVDLSSLKGNRQGVGSSVLNEMFRDPQGQNWLNNFNKVAETFGDKGAAKLLPNAAKYLNVKKAVAQSLLNSDKMTNTITQQPDLLGQIPNPPPEAPASAAPPVPPSFLGNDPEDFKNGYDPRSEGQDAPSGNRRNTPGDATSAQTRGPQSATAPQGPGPGAPPQPPPQPQGNAPAQAGVGGPPQPPQPINPTGPVPLPVPPGAVPPGLPPGVPPQGVQPPPVPMMPPPAGPPGSYLGQGAATPGASLKKAPPADVKFSPKAKIQAMYKALPGAPQHVEVGAYTDPNTGLIHIPEGTAPEKVPGLIAHERAHKEYRGNPALQQQGQQILEAVTRGYPGPLPETVAHLQKYMGLKEYDQPALAEEAYAAQKGFMAGGPPQAGTGAPPQPPQGFLKGQPPPASVNFTNMMGNFGNNAGDLSTATANARNNMAGMGGSTDSRLQGLDQADLAELDRFTNQGYASGEQLGPFGLAAYPAIAAGMYGYEGAKNFPGLLNTVAKIPGLGHLAVDPSSSKPSLANPNAGMQGFFQGMANNKTMGSIMDTLGGFGGFYGTGANLSNQGSAPEQAGPPSDQIQGSSTEIGPITVGDQAISDATSGYTGDSGGGADGGDSFGGGGDYRQRIPRSRPAPPPMPKTGGFGGGRERSGMREGGFAFINRQKRAPAR